jgi:hypothetical protein
LDVSELKYLFLLSNEIKLSFQLLDGMDMLPPDTIKVAGIKINFDSSY